LNLRKGSELKEDLGVVSFSKYVKLPVENSRCPHFSRDRMRNFVVSLLCFCFPILSRFLHEGGIRVSTHLLKLPGCGLKTLTGIPCPFCGMTRSFSELSSFHIREAFNIQPAGVVIYFLCLISGLFFLSRAVLGKPFINLKKGKYWTLAFNILLVFIGIVWIFRII